jgi:hypothetical protein
MKRIAFIIIFFLSCFTGIYAQNIPSGSCGIVFSYDNAGNRTQMEYYCNNTARMAYSDTTSSQTKNIKNENYVEVNALYPNPTSGVFWITFATPVKNERIFLVDGTGKMVQQIKASGTRVEFNLSSVANGIYFIRIEMSDGSFISKKVMKM